MGRWMRVETAIIGLIGVALGSVISGVFQLLNSKQNAEKETIRNLKDRLLDESLNLADSTVELLRNMKKLGGAVIPNGMDPGSETAKEIDSQGTLLVDQLFDAFDQAERLTFRVEIIGGKSSNEVAKRIKKNVDDYFQKLASRDYAFYAEEYQKEIGDLHKLLKELIRAIKQDLDIERYVAGASRCKGRLKKRN